MTNRAPLRADKSKDVELDKSSWIAVDWGTTNLRAWAIDADGGVRAQASSDRGMARLSPGDFEGALLQLIMDWLPADRRTLVVACGMVGARQGWIEAPYSEAPCPPASIAAARRPPTRDPRLDVRILAGIMQRRPAPDVMRGEETQIAGALLDDPTFDGVMCLPGTHTKWARVSAGRIEQFQTCMTGEMFALLSTQSVLRFSLDATNWDAAEFGRAVDAAALHPENVAGSLFSIRAASLVEGLAPGAARARLSGLLIGAEIASTRAYWSDSPVLVIGGGGQAGLYVEGLRLLGAATKLAPAADATLAGLRAARAIIVGETA